MGEVAAGGSLRPGAGSMDRRRAATYPIAMVLFALVLCGLFLPPSALAGRSERPRPPAPTFSRSDDGSRLLLTVPAAEGAPGYRLELAITPFEVATVRAGRTVLRTAPGAGPEGPLTFTVGDAPQRATAIESWRWRRGTLTLTVATSSSEHKILYRVTPLSDRYRVSWSVTGSGAGRPTVIYDVASAGQWFGQGEVRDRKEPQPWPLNDGRGVDETLTPFGDVKSPFWLTSSSIGLWLDTIGDVVVSLDHLRDGVARFGLLYDTTFDYAVFVEDEPRGVYDDYVDVIGKPEKSDTTAVQYAEPIWNTWAQFYSSETQERVLEYAEGLASNGLGGHTLQIDGGWDAVRGNFRFDPTRFPDPRGMVERLHGLGFDVGLWTSFFINTDSRNFELARSRGYLLADAADPSQPCIVTYWAGVAGIVDLANPDARNWYDRKLRGLMRRYGVDGFKFDTRFYDRSCAPRGELRPFDYLELGGDVADRYDLQGVGIRFAWGAQARRGFLTRQVDKGTDWAALQMAVRQNLSLAVAGHPFVATDMIGGSLQKPPPLKETLIRWAQAASLTPVMYASTSPLGVTNAVTGEQRIYDAQTIELYRRAVEQHRRLDRYLRLGVQDAVATGEPMMKPLFLDFPERRTYSIADQWMLGDAVLAAPILSEVPARDIYLPRGAWYDSLAGTVIRGNALLPQYPADLGALPAFVLLGTPETAVAGDAFAGRAAQAVLGGPVSRGGKLPLSVRCPRTHAGPCQGSLAIGAPGLGTPGVRPGESLAAVTTSYDVAQGQRAVVTVRLSAADVRRLRRLGEATAWAVTREQADPAARVQSRLSTFRVAAPPPPKPPRRDRERGRR